jgi:hypothetical protein
MTKPRAQIPNEHVFTINADEEEYEVVEVDGENEFVEAEGENESSILYKARKVARDNVGYVALGMGLAAANVPRFFSAEKAFSDLFHTEDEYLTYPVGVACWIANTVLGVYGLYKAIEMYNQGKLKKDPLFILLSVGTAASDVFNGIVLSSNPITKSDALWSKIYTGGAAVTVGTASFFLNLFSTLNMYALWCRDKEDVIAAEELNSLSYSLIGKSVDELKDLRERIAKALGLKPDTYQGSYTLSMIAGNCPESHKERKAFEKLAEALGLNRGLCDLEKMDVAIVQAFSDLTSDERLEFMSNLRVAGFSISSTRNVELSWFMKGVSIALAVPSAIALFYGPYTLLERYCGKSEGAIIAAALFGLFPIPVKTSVYYNLLRRLFDKMLHGMDTLRNFIFIEEMSSMLKKILIPTAFVAFSAWISTSGVGFYFSVEDFCQFIYGLLPQDMLFNAGVGGFSDGLSDLASAGLSQGPSTLGFLEWIYEIIGTINACGINFSSVLAMIEVFSQNYLSKGYNPLSQFFDAEGTKLSSTMPPKTLTWSIMPAFVSSGSSGDDEESGPFLPDESSPLSGGNSSNTSRYSFFYSCASAIGEPLKYIGESLAEAAACCYS